jgi:hypothetical protein
LHDGGDTEGLAVLDGESLGVQHPPLVRRVTITILKDCQSDHSAGLPVRSGQLIDSTLSRFTTWIIERTV